MRVSSERAKSRVTMPLHTLELEQLQLVNSADKIKLSAICLATFQLPPFIASLSHTDILKALTSGHIWTSRGVGCHLDIEISLDGKPLDNTMRPTLLAGFGRQLYSALIWQQLSLLPILAIDPASSSEPNRPDISIALKHGNTQSISKAWPRGWVLDKTDIIPPSEVPQAELESLLLQMNFLTIDVPERAEARISEVRDEDLDMFLLNESMAPPKVDHLSQLEDAVRRISGLPLIVETNFRQSQPKSARPSGVELVVIPQMFVSENNIHQNSTSHIIHLKSSTSSKTRFFSKEVTDTLRAWMESHSLSLYPTEVEKRELMMKTGLTRKQLMTWMVNYRKRTPAMSSRRDEDEMLFSTILSKESMPEEDPTDLLSQLSDDTIFLPSSSTSRSTALPSQCSSPFDQSSQVQKPLLENPAAGRLIDGALQTLIGGYYPRIRLPLDIQIEKPITETSLSQIVPTMFNPGYRELMAHNSRFLPTITNALSISLPKNVQSPSLKKKLEQLAALSPSPLRSEHDTNETVDTSQRLSQVIQTRLFSMLQQSLYDLSATRKLWKKPKNKREPQDDDSTPELLDDEEPKKEGGNNWDEMLAHFTSEDDFDDLLYGDDEDELDLLDEAGRERLAIERETDDMLFGDGWNGDEDDGDEFLLFSGGTDGENMLL